MPTPLWKKAAYKKVVEALEQFRAIVTSSSGMIRGVGKERRMRTEFGTAIEVLLKAAGWSMMDLSRASGINDVSIHYYIRGKLGRRISRDEVCMIAWALAAGLDGMSVKTKCCYFPSSFCVYGRSKLDVILDGLLILADYYNHTPERR